jgi:alpha,alpha-trehalose phosphorylase
MVSLTQRGVVALCYEVEPVGSEARVVLQSELVADEELVELSKGDPGQPRPLSHPLESRSLRQRTGGHLVHRTTAERHPHRRGDGARVEAPDGVEVDVSADAVEDWARVSVTCRLSPARCCASSRSSRTGGRTGGRCRRSATRSPPR